MHRWTDEALQWDAKMLLLSGERYCRLMMDLRLTRCCKRQVNDSCELMSHSDKLLRGYYGQMRCCDRLMRGCCGEVRAGARKHPSGWRPKFSVQYGNGGTTVTTKNYIRLRCTNLIGLRYQPKNSFFLCFTKIKAWLKNLNGLIFWDWNSFYLCKNWSFEIGTLFISAKIQNGIRPDLFALTLVTFRHNSIVKVLWNFSAALKVNSVAYIFGFNNNIWRLLYKVQN